MKLSCVWALGLASYRVRNWQRAAALDAPQQPCFITPNRSQHLTPAQSLQTAHHARSQTSTSVHPAHPGLHSAVAHTSAHRRSSSTSSQHRASALRAHVRSHASSRHHRYYERFTASSFVSGRHLCRRRHGRRRSGGSPGSHRRSRRHERHRRGHRSLQRPHSGHGQPEAGAFARRRALLHHQAYRGPGRAF